MSGGPHFSYVQSRLQARHGRRLDESAWRVLETTDDFPSYLQAARSSFFETWIYHLSEGADIHQVERSLRQDWFAYCRDVAAWLPAPWRPPVEWTATLAYLPALAHLSRAEPVWAWMPDDSELAPFAVRNREARQQALAASRYGELARAIGDGADPMSAWLAAWIALAPSDKSPDRKQLRKLADVIHNGLSEAGDGTERNVDRLRPALREDLTRLFRQFSGTALAAFAHLGLIALDVERLRAGLVLRLVLPQSEERPSWA